MKALLLAVVAGAISALAFPPYGPGWLVLVGVSLLMVALRVVRNRRQGLLVGAVYGLVFFGWLMWWLIELEIIALVLVPVQAAFLAAYAWWLSGYRDRSDVVWLVLAVSGWGFMELIRYYFPVGGLEWGAAGYALSDSPVRLIASVYGTTGLTLLIVLFGVSASIALLGTRRVTSIVGFGALALLFVGFLVGVTEGHEDEGMTEPVVVQGSTPCPFEHCPPDERLRTFEQHLALTRTLPADETGSPVVWPEGSTGSFNADPVQNPEIGAAISAEAQRLGSWFVVGSDRPLDEESWVNANVFFDPEGVIVGEYRKQHPVPFGEYIPLRPLFEWIPALDRVPRDMIPGDGPFVVDTGDYNIGSVISFEGGFSRYSLETRRAGADLIIVNTNEASYGPDAPTADQFIGMTRMRAAELGVPVVHAAVTGKSTIIDHQGELMDTTELGTIETYMKTVGTPISTPYTTIGDSFLYLAAVVAVLMWGRDRWLVGSAARSTEEE